MGGSVLVTRTGDWLTPFAVEVQPAEGQPATATFAAAAKAQEYALLYADQGYTVVYRIDPEDAEGVDVLQFPTNKGNRKTSTAEISAREFQERYSRICQKCRKAKPLTQYGSIYHRNRTSGREVFHGYAKRCDDCGGGE